VLLEWPDRAAGFLPPDRLDIAMTLMPQQALEIAALARDRIWGFAPRVERLPR
jgi:hypothetical protein